jgi:acyl-CoA thioester hydrolase
VKFENSFIVKAEDIDAQGHVNNVVYLQWIQDVAVAHWLSRATDEQKSEIAWVVMRHEIDYLRPAFENEEIAVATWVGEPQGAKWERFTEIRRDEKTLVKAKSIWVALDKQTLRPRRVTMEIKNTFQQKKIMSQRKYNYEFEVERDINDGKGFEKVDNLTSALKVITSNGRLCAKTTYNLEDRLGRFEEPIPYDAIARLSEEEIYNLLDEKVDWIRFGKK